jgi:hypothetical protein
MRLPPVSVFWALSGSPSAIPPGKTVLFSRQLDPEAMKRRASLVGKTIQQCRQMLIWAKMSNRSHFLKTNRPVLVS